jgi:hypothetical protein
MHLIPVPERVGYVLHTKDRRNLKNNEKHTILIISKRNIQYDEDDYGCLVHSLTIPNQMHKLFSSTIWDE